MDKELRRRQKHKEHKEAYGKKMAEKGKEERRRKKAAQEAKAKAKADSKAKSDEAKSDDAKSDEAASAAAAGSSAERSEASNSKHEKKIVPFGPVLPPQKHPFGPFPAEETAEEKAAKELQWHRKAAYQGDAQAQYNLGCMYHKGERGLPRNLANALMWHRKAANQGLREAQYNLAVVLSEGEAPDAEEVVHWLEKAKEQGLDEAGKALALLQTQLKDGLWEQLQQQLQEKDKRKQEEEKQKREEWQQEQEELLLLRKNRKPLAKKTNEAEEDNVDGVPSITPLDIEETKKRAKRYSNDYRQWEELELSDDEGEKDEDASPRLPSDSYPEPRLEEAPYPSHLPPVEDMLNGTVVELQDLEKKPELNGQPAVIATYVTKLKRFQVFLADGRGPMAVKAENLKVKDGISNSTKEWSPYPTKEWSDVPKVPYAPGF